MRIVSNFMPIILKKIIYSIILNLSFFLILIIAIQNSSHKNKVNFMVGETVNLPISFLIGVSFISGSITGSLLTLNSHKKED